MVAELRAGRSLLDQILDRIEDNTPMLVVFQTPECENPQIAGVQSYKKGCRCRRCTDSYHASPYTVSRRDADYTRRQRARNTQPPRWRR